MSCFANLCLKLACLAVVTAAATFAQTPGGTPAIFGDMKPGPHAVGFRVLRLRDPSRVDQPKRNYYGEVNAADRSRVIDVHLWYPAQPSTAPRMTIADSMDSSEPEARSAAGRVAKRNFIEPRFGKVSDEVWDRFLTTPLLAQASANPAAGKFPLILGTLRPFSTTLTNEYLASHGYVVAMTIGLPDSTPPIRGLQSGVRDMEFAWAHLKGEPYVDGSHLALLGFSEAGFSQFLWAMRNHDVDAIVDLESAIFGIPDFLTSFGYDPKALRAPFLHTYSVSLAKLDKNFDEFEKMKYSHRFHYLVDPPQNDHWDFATEGMGASTVLGLRAQAAPLLRKAFEMTNLYVLNFFNAFVKGHAAAMAFLRRDPGANGAPEKLVTMRELPALKAAPTAADVNLIVTRQGIAEALRVFQQARQADPEAAVFAEASVNQLAYALFNQKKLREAIEFFKWNVATYPASANAHDSLAEAYEAAGDMAAARKSAEAALAAADAQPGLNDATRTRLKEIQTQRLMRLARKD